MLSKFREAYRSENWLEALEAGFGVFSETLSLIDAAHLYEVGARTRSAVGFPLVVEAFKVFFGLKNYRSFLVSNFYQKDGRVLYAMIEVSENPGISYSDLLDVVACGLIRGLSFTSWVREEDRLFPQRPRSGFKLLGGYSPTPFIDLPGTLQREGGRQFVQENKDQIEENTHRKLLEAHLQRRAGVDRALQRVFSGKVPPLGKRITYQLSMDGKVLERDGEDRVFLGTCEMVYPLLREIFQIVEPPVEGPLEAHLVGEEGVVRIPVVRDNPLWVEHLQEMYEEGDLPAEECLGRVLEWVGRFGER